MGTGLGDFALAVIIGAAGIVASLGGAMMFSKEHRRAAMGCFVVSGLLFWSLGVMWAINATGQAMLYRLITAGIVGAASATFTVWVITATSTAPLGSPL